MQGSLGIRNDDGKLYCLCKKKMTAGAIVLKYNKTDWEKNT